MIPKNISETNKRTAADIIITHNNCSAMVVVMAYKDFEEIDIFAISFVAIKQIGITPRVKDAPAQAQNKYLKNAPLWLSFNKNIPIANVKAIDIASAIIRYFLTEIKTSKR